MPSYFFDSSAIVKRYHRKPGTAWVQAVSESLTHPPIYFSLLGDVEVVAALSWLGRHEKLHRAFVNAMQITCERHLALSDPGCATPVYILVTALSLATTPCTRYWEMQPFPLRSQDAIQLACAIAAAKRLSDELFFVTTDTRIAAIAPLEGLRVINPLYLPQQ